MSKASGKVRGPKPEDIFAALGDRTRLSLVRRLSDAETRSISSLCADTRLTRQAVTKHLRVLERAGVVRCRRVGREQRFTYDQQSIDRARECLNDVSTQWDDALSRLRLFVEG